MGLCASSNPGAVKAADLVGLKRKDKLKIVFKHLDANGNGVLTLDEMMTTAAHLTTVEVKAIQNEFEELDKDRNYVLHEAEFISKHILAYQDLPDEKFDEWIIDICKLHEHSEEELKKFGIHKSSKEFLGGIPEDVQEKMNKENARKAKKAQDAADKLKKDKEDAELLNHLNHMKEDITTVIHQHDAPHQSGTAVNKDRKKKKAYVVDEELGRLQDQIANFDLLDDDDEIIEGDGHKHKHHHHHHHHKHKHHHHHHHHHHSKNADEGNN